MVHIARQIPWPSGFTERVRRNEFVQRWHGREAALEDNTATEGPRYRQAFAEGDPENTGVWFGEAAGLIYEIKPAAAIIEEIMSQATTLLNNR